ncbi:unnamed protein product [Prunus armeniaca]|uniref:Uncharacterized protein n=1 Tax=Prunus armeniaca TaxID=36596 RepID=A0A6J5WC47_PRUAR|nr:unnamed protein product [Prunus armeniaca]CAB4295888.1 unnamed protein product [Prunus armeniaca]
MPGLNSHTSPFPAHDLAFPVHDLEFPTPGLEPPHAAPPLTLASGFQPPLRRTTTRPSYLQQYHINIKLPSMSLPSSNSASIEPQGTKHPISLMSLHMITCHNTIAFLVLLFQQSKNPSLLFKQLITLNVVMSWHKN